MIDHNLFQILRVIGIILTCATLILFFRILIHQLGFVNKNTLTFRLVVLNVRTVLLLPIFSICYLISLEFETMYVFMILPESIIQAYATFSFVALFIHYAGGPEQCLEIFKKSHAHFPSMCFKGCLSEHPRSFYNFIYFTQVQFLVLRPIVVIGEIVAEVQGRVDISNILSGVSSFMIIVGLLGLFKMYNVLYDHVKGLNAKKKMIVIKGSISLIIVEGLVEQILAAVNVIGLQSVGLVVRVYCFGVLIELFLMALMLERIFASEIKTDKAVNPEFAPHIVINGPDDGVHEITFISFVRSIFFFRDLFPPMNFSKISNPTDQPALEGGLNTRLTQPAERGSRPLAQLAGSFARRVQGDSPNVAPRESSNNFMSPLSSFDATSPMSEGDLSFAANTQNRLPGQHRGSAYYNTRASADIL